MILLKVKASFDTEDAFYLFKKFEEAQSFMEILWSNAMSTPKYEGQNTTGIELQEYIFPSLSFINEGFAIITWKKGDDTASVKFTLAKVKDYSNYNIKDEVVVAYKQNLENPSYHVIYRLSNGKYRNYYDGKDIFVKDENYLKNYSVAAGNFDSLIQAKNMLLKHRPGSTLAYEGGIFYGV